MRLVDADALKTEVNFSVTITGKDNAVEVKRLMELYNKAIDNAPTIEAEQVVYCRDCKYFELNHEDIEYKPCNGIEWCTNWCGGTTAEGYCCEAERREP